MPSPAIQKIIIVIVLIAGLGYFGYYSYSNVPEPDPASVEISSPDSETQTILDLAKKLATITIDQTIFSSSLLASLRDFEVPLVDEPQGRDDPFKPVTSAQIKSSGKVGSVGI
jgi:hypothetical protein